MAARACSAPGARLASATSGRPQTRCALPAFAVARRLAFLIVVLLCAAVPNESGAACAGRDLFPIIAAQEPEAFAAIETARAAAPFAQGTLFRLSRDGETSYVFGTVHLNDPRGTTFRPSVVVALEGSKTLVLESVETGARLAQAMQDDPWPLRAALLARKDQRAGALVDQEDFRKLEALVAHAGLKAAAADELKPAVLALLLDLPACARGGKTHPYGDEALGNMARAAGLEVVGLETMVEQLDSLDGLSPPVERELLIATLRQAAHAEDVVETTLARYANQDIGGLLAWMKSPALIPGVAFAATPPAFLDRLIARRNRRMLHRALPLAEKGGAFIAVGAAHLPGENGLLRLFEREGFKVESVE